MEEGFILEREMAVAAMVGREGRFVRKPSYSVKRGNAAENMACLRQLSLHEKVHCCSAKSCEHFVRVGRAFTYGCVPFSGMRMRNVASGRVSDGMLWQGNIHFGCFSHQRLKKGG